MKLLVSVLAVVLMLGAQAREAAVYVATYIETDPQATAQGIAVLQEYREASRGETGNANIDVMQELGRPNRFMIIEVWRDESSFQSHEQAGHTTQFRASLRAIQNSPYDQRVHQGLVIDPAPSRGGQGTVFEVTHVDVPPWHEDDAETLLEGLAEESRKDSGNVRYDVLQQNPPLVNHFTLFAAWNDSDAFDAYQAEPHRRQFRETLGPMLGAPYDERLYKLVP